MKFWTKTAGSIAVTIILVSGGSALAQVAGQWRDGRQLYDKICRYCHESGVGPALWGRDLHVDYIISRTRHGSAGMPAFRSTEIDNAMLTQLAELIAKGPMPTKVGEKP